MTPGGAATRQLSRRELRESPDAVLLAEARRGVDAAFGELVRRHRPRALALAAGVLRDRAEAEEVVQDALLRAHHCVESFHGDSAFFTWLFRIVLNVAIDRVRRLRRRDQLWDEGRSLPISEGLVAGERHDVCPLGVLARRQLAHVIDAALDALPDYHRGVIEMRELEGLSYEEMAARMRVSKGTIMSRLFHARRKLQLVLASWHAPPAGLDDEALAEAG